MLNRVSIYLTAPSISTFICKYSLNDLIHVGFFKSDITENHSHFIELNEKIKWENTIYKGPYIQLKSYNSTTNVLLTN